MTAVVILACWQAELLIARIQSKGLDPAVQKDLVAEVRRISPPNCKLPR